MITSLTEVTEYPLCWPVDRPRASRREDDPWRANFARAHKKLEDEMRRIEARGFVVSMAPKHFKGSVDPAVAVWFNAKPKAPSAPAELRVLACDRYRKPEGNLHAIALTVERLRAIERYGAYSLDQAVEGARVALPPPDGINWRETFGPIPTGLPANELLSLMELRYRGKAKIAQGDDALRRINLAIEAARKELRS